MNFLGFTGDETIPYVAISLLVIWVIANNYSKGFRNFWSPTTLIAIIFGYYCVLGPYYAIATGETHDRLLNMRPFYTSAFIGAFVFVVSTLTGFNINNQSYRFNRLSVSNEMIGEYGRKVCIIGFILFTISTGGRVVNLLNPLNAEAVEQTGGSLGNYLGLSVNFLIPGVTLLFVYYLRTKQGVIWLITFLLITAGIFTSLGFRYRLVLLLGSLVVTYYLSVKRRPNITVGIVSIFFFIILMGALNEARQYGQGIDTQKLQGDSESYFESGLNESRIFQTSGAIIDIVPERHPHAGFKPIVSTLLFPIPSAVLQGKNSAEYLFDALDAIYGKTLSEGSAFLSYGEYYLAFGWFGIIGAGLLIGWFYKKLWIWFMSDPDNPLNIAVYSVTVCYVYVIISRGYLPQVTMLFFFSVFPIFVVLRRMRKRQSGIRLKTPEPNVA